jgi:hypothetical protein
VLFVSTIIKQSEQRIIPKLFSSHKEGVRISKTTKKLASICCPKLRETKADTLKATEANRKRGTRN